MLLFQVEPPPPPPPPIRMYRTYLPVVQTERSSICVGVEGQYEARCDHVYRDNNGRWYLTDEGLYDQFVTEGYFTIDGHLYAVIAVYGWETLPDYNNILYIKIGDMYYWAELAILG